MFDFVYRLLSLFLPLSGLVGLYFAYLQYQKFKAVPVSTIESISGVPILKVPSVADFLLQLKQQIIALLLFIFVTGLFFGRLTALATFVGVIFALIVLYVERKLDLASAELQKFSTDNIADDVTARITDNGQMIFTLFSTSLVLLSLGLFYLIFGNVHDWRVLVGIALGAAGVSSFVRGAAQPRFINIYLYSTALAVGIFALAAQATPQTLETLTAYSKGQNISSLKFVSWLMFSPLLVIFLQALTLATVNLKMAKIIQVADDHSTKIIFQVVTTLIFLALSFIVLLVLPIDLNLWFCLLGGSAAGFLLSYINKYYLKSRALLNLAKDQSAWSYNLVNVIFKNILLHLAVLCLALILGGWTAGSIGVATVALATLLLTNDKQGVMTAFFVGLLLLAAFSEFYQLNSSNLDLSFNSSMFAAGLILGMILVLLVLISRYSLGEKKAQQINLVVMFSGVLTVGILILLAYSFGPALLSGFVFGSFVLAALGSLLLKSLENLERGGGNKSLIYSDELSAHFILIALLALLLAPSTI